MNQAKEGIKEGRKESKKEGRKEKKESTHSRKDRLHSSGLSAEADGATRYINQHAFIKLESSSGNQPNLKTLRLVSSVRLSSRKDGYAPGFCWHSRTATCADVKLVDGGLQNRSRGVGWVMCGGMRHRACPAAEMWGRGYRIVRAFLGRPPSDDTRMGGVGWQFGMLAAWRRFGWGQ